MECEIRKRSVPMKNDKVPAYGTADEKTLIEWAQQLEEENAEHIGRIEEQELELESLLEKKRKATDAILEEQD